MTLKSSRKTAQRSVRSAYAWKPVSLMSERAVPHHREVEWIVMELCLSANYDRSRAAIATLLGLHIEEARLKTSLNSQTPSVHLATARLSA